jgi:CheY-like chemotaxis protein
MSAMEYHGEATLVELRDDFLIEARDRLEDSQAALEGIYSNTIDFSDAVSVVRRNAHSLIGMGKSSDFPTVSLVAHRLVDFLAEISSASNFDAKDIQTYLDYIDEILTCESDPGPSDASSLVRVLPNGSQFNVENFECREVEVLLVVPSRAVRRAVETELAQCGYRVSIAQSPWEAMELAVCTLPDIIISSVVMDPISGTDLVRALSQIKVVEGTDFAVLTSFEPGHVELQGLAPEVGIIGMGNHFHDNLGDFVAKFESKPGKTDVSEYHATRPLRVLLIEDVRANQLLIETVLGKYGLEITVANNGALGVEAFRASEFDLVLMDIVMPVMDGIDAARAIRALPGNGSNVPIIALTGRAGDEDKATYLQSGMNDTVKKPLVTADLIVAIERQCDVAFSRAA